MGAREELLWVLELAHDNHPDSHGRIADAFLARFDITPKEGRDADR